MAEATVRAQASRTGKRWGYVLAYPDGQGYVSEARWGSPEAAIKAGEADAAACEKLEDSNA